MNEFAKVDKETFYRFAARHAEQRFEYVRGRIVQQMTGGTQRHGLVAARICQSIASQIEEQGFFVIIDRGVDTGSSVRYPDVVVERAGEDKSDSLSTKRPLLIVEVLSPSTASDDLDHKPIEYLALPSLEAYVVASQSEPAMQIWVRKKDGKFPKRAREIEGRDEVVAIRSRALAIELPLATIYRGIG